MIFEGTTKTTTTPEEACGNADMRNNGLEQRAWEGSHQDCDRVTLGKSWPDYLPKHGSNSQSQQQSKSVRFRSVVFNLQQHKDLFKSELKDLPCELPKDPPGSWTLLCWQSPRNTSSLP